MRVECFFEGKHTTTVELSSLARVWDRGYLDISGEAMEKVRSMKVGQSVYEGKHKFVGVK